MEDDDYDDLMEVETDDEVIPSEFTGKLNEKFVKSWERPEVAKFEPQKDSIIFQQIEIDYTMGDVVPGYSATSVGPVPILRLFGVNEKGNSVLAYVHGYMPYFYIVAPNNFKESDCEGVRLKLNNHMKIHRSSFQYADFVLEVCIIRDHRSIMGYKPNPYPFLKITMAAPMLVPTARKIFERGEIMPATTTFESNIQFALRFMIDKDIVGASWIECPAAKYQLVEESKKQSLSQIELIIRSDDIVSLGVDGEWAKIAPIRLLSFDIECTSRKGVFPEPEMDSVIQIGNYVNVQGMDAPLVKTIFTFRGCSPIVGSQVISFNDEKEMLENWSRFVRYIDPDIITGYNIANFDFYYLTQRAKALKANQFLFLSRITREKSRIKEAEFSSKAYGRRVTKTLAMSGRVQLDMLLVMQRDYKLRSYTLNAVSAHFLGQQKEDVHYSNISELFNGTDNDRRRLAVYCLKDSYLPLLLMDKLMVVVNYLEMARVTGVPVNYLLAHGQQVKVQSQLYRKARQVKLIIPTVTVKVDGGDEVAYEGATVIPPKSGFYDKPISTLDFASLYPSIMMAHNLCYSTLLTAEDAKMLPPSSYVRTPSGDYFLKREVQQGVLPCILEELIAARKTARKALEQEKDPFRAAVHNGRQLALKISANSVYGFTGALRGKLPCIAISASVTAFGRVMIDQTKKLVEEKYNIANGYKNDAVVIYGDTDSVMVKFGVETVKEAMELGREASQFVSATFVKPINLEFEKVYFPYLLMKKKRYAGLLWTKEDKHDKMDAKGIVTVRRDNCSLVREVIDTCLHKILIERDPASAELFVKKVVADLLQNKIDLSLLVITKALSKNEYQVKQAHVELAERMKKRDAGSAPSLGDRIPYVIVQRGGKSVPAYEKAEDPLFVLENNIDLDLQYYLEHQLKKPLIAIFGPIMKNPQSLISGEHTMTVASSTPKSSSFFKTGFVKRQVRCMNCNAVIQNDDKAILCTYCKQLGIEVKMYQQAMKNVTDLEVKFSRIWTQCQSCQGSFHQPVLCTSRDCPIFYMRKKVQKDLNHAQENLERFQADDW